MSGRWHRPTLILCNVGAGLAGAKPATDISSKRALKGIGEQLSATSNGGNAHLYF